MKACFLFLLILFFSGSLLAQRAPKINASSVNDPGSSITPSNREEALIPTLKKTGHYTTKDWRSLIDSLWGPGLPTATKLSVFDKFWNTVDQTWGGFPNLSINWDSLRNVYRPEVASGVSRGRFSAILTRLTRELCEWHVGALDTGIDSTMGYLPDLTSFPVRYPNYSEFRYRPGLPIVNFDLLFWRTNFGAGVTLADDSTLLVYSVMPNHPLSLQPGDIILGYDRKPWKELYQELLDAELPILSSDLCGVRLGSTPTASFHTAMISAGMNWGLYDTIDVVKYPVNDTVHLPTSLLAAITPPYHIATEQMPVPGVPFPDIQNKKLVSWGVVQGTNIGYIYGWDWGGVPWGQTRDLFGQAVDDLMHKKKVQGLILDFRTNPGGWPEFANIGLSHLFNFDPTSNYSDVFRVTGADHFAFTKYPMYNALYFVPTPELFQYPIAVLTGPMSGSSGDYNAFRLRFHPMVRFFGRPTAGAYTDFTTSSQFGYIGGPYFLRVDDGGIFSNINNEGYMIHKTFPVDEEVWLTRDGVVKGEDDVVKRALEWISSLTYAHDIALDRYYGRPGTDSITARAVLANPLQHASVVSAVLSGAPAVHDSVLLYNDGLHGDGAAGDSIWGARLLAPASEGNFLISVETRDLTQGTIRHLPNIAKLTTAGPLVLNVVQWLNDASQSYCEVLPHVKNLGSIAPFSGGTISLSSPDSAVTSVVPALRTFYDIAPGDSEQSSGAFIVQYDPSKIHGSSSFTLHFSMGFQGHACWDTTYMLTVTGVAEDKPLPKTYALEQNYPNPFNPKTGVRFQVSGVSDVKLTVYDLLGREVAVLVNERKAPGRYEVTFDGAGLASGVYVCRMTAGSFAQSRKMILVK